MLRTFASIGTAGLLALTASATLAQGNTNCQSCNNSGGLQATPWVEASGTYYGQCDSCDNGSCHGGSMCSSKGWPDRGWNPPAHYPVNRDGIWYRNMWPQAWYGNPGGGFIANSPMVYQPTDTTQLGYSYAKVPTWQSINMTPPTPNPANFHARVCVPRPHAGRLVDGCPSCNAGGYGQSAGCPSCQQGHVMNGYAPQPYAVAQPGIPAQSYPAVAVPAAVGNPASAVPAQQPQVAAPSKEYQQVSHSEEAPGVFHLANLKRLFN